jgi:Primase X
LSSGQPALTDLELRYPFSPSSRRFFETVPVEEGLASAEVQQQAELKLMNAVGRVAYEPHISEFIEFSSFFAAALVAGQEPYLTSAFAKKEGERAKEFFVRENGNAKPVIMRECFGAAVGGGGDGRGQTFSMAFQDYLTLVSKYELAKTPEWKLGRRDLQGGVVRLSDNLLNDLFGDCAQKAIAEGARNLRRAQFPKTLSDLRTRVIRYVPEQRPRSGRGYLYVEELLKHPVSDGRHRLVWMVLAPYLVNVKKVDDAEAVDRIRAFVSVAGETGDMRRFVEYNVRRAKRNGLLPPTLTTMKNEHPDLYHLLPKEAAVEPSQKKAARPAR